MASSSLNHRYLLPGERTTSSVVVHQHGISSTVSSDKDLLIRHRIYEPKENDLVLGIVIVRAPDCFIVDINSPEPAILPIVSFDSGRLPTRQAMNRFSIVYARVVRADPWTQVELSCQTDNRATRRSNFGLIDQGHLLRCSLTLITKLQQSQLIHCFNPMVRGFHTVFTQNGFIWYITETMNSMIAVKNVIYKHELENDTDRLIDLYKILMEKLERQDHSRIESKPKELMKMDTETIVSS